MKLRTRRILYIFTATAFLALVPLVLSYGFGIRYNPSQSSFVRTGGAYVNAYPKTVDITYDGKTEQFKTPARIRYVAPGDYIVTISRSGYTPLSTNVSVRSGEVVLLDPIELIPTQTESSRTLPAHQVFVSPYAPISLLTVLGDATSSADILQLYNDRGDSKTLGDIPQAPIEVSWNHQTGDAIVTSQNGATWVFSHQEEKLYLVPEGFTHLTLAVKETGILYGQKNNEIFRVDVRNSETTKTPFTGEFAYKHNGNILLVQTNDTKQDIIIKNTSNNSQELIGQTEGTKKITTLSDDIALLESQEGAYLINVRLGQLLFLDAHITARALKESTLYYSNGFEIWSVNLSLLEKNFISRLSDSVTTLTPSPRGSGLFVTTPSQILFWYTNTPTPANVIIKTVPAESTSYVQLNDENEFRFYTQTKTNLQVDTYLF